MVAIVRAIVTQYGGSRRIDRRRAKVPTNRAVTGSPPTLWAMTNPLMTKNTCTPR